MKVLVERKRAKPDYELKAKVISNGCATLLRKQSLTHWKIHQEYNSIDFKQNGQVDKLERLYDLKNDINTRLDNYSYDEIIEGIKVNNASYKRTTRLKEKVCSMLKKNECIFLTLTFRDDVLSKTSVDTRRKYIQRFLKENCIEYIANIDYGAKNEREHYHAVVIAKNNIIDSAFYIYGAINFERVRLKKNDDYDITSKKLSKYVNKLTNHAIKNTVKQNRVIYSR